MNKTSYHSKLVGVTFEGRQDTIGMLEGNELLRFRREPENEYDKNAVAVDVFIEFDQLGKKREEWMPIGYIARDKNSELAKVLTDGKEASIKLSEITGGGENSYGVNVYIEYEKERKLTRSPNAFLVKDIFGNEIFYDDVAHEYTNALGEVYTSGSKYAGQFERPFDAVMISNKMVTKHGLDAGHATLIQDMWKLKAEASASFGTAIHAALELYGKYKGLAESLAKETHAHDNPVLKKAVDLFYEEYPETDNVGYETLVVDHSRKRAGRIDRLEYNEDGSVWITDFKTNFDIKKNLKKYWLQLSFYAAIVEANGVKVKGLKIYHYTGEQWDTIYGEVVAIDAFELPVRYDTLSPTDKATVRNQYVELQEGMCFHCNESLSEEAPERIRSKEIDWSKFPENFLKYPVHLQHDHITGMTEGAVHNYCNAVMWQYEGR